MRELTDSEQEAYLAAWDKYHEDEPRAGGTIGEHWAFEAAYIAGLDHSAALLAALQAELDTLKLQLKARDTLLMKMGIDPARIKADSP